MGVDLCLIPHLYDASGLPVSSFSRLAFEYRYLGLWSELKKAAHLIPEGIRWYGDNGIEDRLDDQCGDKLTFMFADDLAAAVAGYFSTRLQATCKWDLAILAFLESLDPGVRIVLWWQ